MGVPMSQRRIPPSTDAVQLTVIDEKVHLYCLLCMEDIGEPFYLCDAIRLWEQHQAKVKKNGGG